MQVALVLNEPSVAPAAYAFLPLELRKLYCCTLQRLCSRYPPTCRLRKSHAGYPRVPNNHLSMPTSTSDDHQLTLTTAWAWPVPSCNNALG